MIDLDQNTSAAFGDLDGDDDLDLVVTDYRGAFYLHRNNGGSAAPAYAEVSGSASPFGHFCVQRHRRRPRWRISTGTGIATPTSA